MPDLSRIKVGILAAATILVAEMSACSSSGTEGSKNRSRNDSVQLETQIEAGQSAESSQRGLQLRVLTVDDAGDRVAQALSPFMGDPGAMLMEDQERWSSWGLRLVVVPIDQLDLVLGSLISTKAAQVRWMGEFPQWRPLIRTAQIPNGTVRVGDDSTSVRFHELSGRPRLLARVWTTPEMTGSDARAQLHLDLALQMIQEQQNNRWETPAVRTALDEGALIAELKMSQVLDSNSALVLVGEDPSIQWINEIGTDLVSVSQASDGSLGPSAPLVRTLGQQMLSTPGTGYVAPGKRYVSPKKVLIVLVPRVGGQYRLLGSNRSQQQGTSP